MNKSIIIFLTIISLVTALGFYGIKAFDDNLAPLPIYGGEGHQVDQFTFFNQNGDVIHSSDYSGKVWIVNYFFTSCPIVCPKMIKNMKEAHDYLRNEDSVMFLSFTVDPKRDTPEKLKSYIEKYQINDKTWHFLTGEKSDLYRLARKSFLLSATEGPGDEYDFIHSENIVVIDTLGRIRSIINGLDEDAEKKIMQAIKKLLNQS